MEVVVAEALTFEQINSAIEKFDVAKHDEATRQIAKQAAGNPALALPQLCPIYKVVRPIIVGLSNLPFIPKKWQDVIKSLIAVLDILCP